MAKNAVTEWSTTAASNTDVGGTGIQGTNTISNFDNAIREMMAQIATFNTAAAFGTVSLTSTDAGALNAPVLELYRNSASPAAADELGAIYFYGKDSGGNKTLYSFIASILADPTNGSEDGTLNFINIVAGSPTVQASMTATGWNSMNIGATTPGTGRFTTLTADGGTLSSFISKSAAVAAGPNALRFNDSANTLMGYVGYTGANTNLNLYNQIGNVQVLASGAVVSIFTSTGMNSTAIGATTASTGAFTTLTSTGGALNGTLGATTPGTVAATTISASSTLTVTGVSTHTGQTQSGDGTVSAPAYSFTGAATTGMWRTALGRLAFSVGGTEYFRVDDSGAAIQIGKLSSSLATAGHTLQTNGLLQSVRASAVVGQFNRTTDDGAIIELLQDGTVEGSISVSGTTVTYGSFCGAHWGQLEDGSKTEILRGTICESIDAMNEWFGDDGKPLANDQLPRFKVSDEAGSRSVYGVFMNWDNDDEKTNDATIASLGAYLIRINKDVKVKRGDLIESNGDGTGRVQDDDLFRSRTVAKVTSPAVIETFADGSYLVPCTLHCG